MNELLPCPFCGNAVTMTDLDDEDDRRIWTRYVECEVCDLKMRDYGVWPKGTMLFTRDMLSDQVGKSLALMWNSRPCNKALLEALENIQGISAGSTTANSLPHIAKIATVAIEGRD